MSPCSCRTSGGDGQGTRATRSARTKRVVPGDVFRVAERPSEALEELGGEVVALEVACVDALGVHGGAHAAVRAVRGDHDVGHLGLLGLGCGSCPTLATAAKVGVTMP